MTNDAIAWTLLNNPAQLHSNQACVSPMQFEE